VVTKARLLVNATPLGMEGERLPEPFHQLTPGQVAYDLVYTPPETPFLLDAHAAGVETHHGLGMLVGQAAASYRRWTGQQAPVATMSAAALAAIADPRPRGSI
jgi:shikimate dehydrogenase